MSYMILGRSSETPESEIDKAIAFAISRLGLDTSYEIVLDFDSDDLDGCQALLDVDEDEAEIVIVISPLLTLEETLKTIFHEFAHIRQIVCGQLRLGNMARATTWLGNPYQKVGYYDAPWEVEAFNLEVSLYQEFIELN